MDLATQPQPPAPAPGAGRPEPGLIGGGGTRMAWLILIGAGLLEIVWAMALKHTDGFTQLWPSALAITAALTSFVMLSVALGSLPVGTAYAVWVGIGAVGVAIAGIIMLDEPASPLRLAFLVVVVTGVIGLRMVEG